MTCFVNDFPDDGVDDGGGNDCDDGAVVNFFDQVMMEKKKKEEEGVIEDIFEFLQHMETGDEFDVNNVVN